MNESIYPSILQPKTEFSKNWVFLNLIPEIGPIRFHQLINIFGSAEKIVNASLSDLIATHILSERNAEIVNRKLQNTAILDKELKAINENDVTIVTHSNPGYPSLLKSIYAPPPVLYCKGNLDLLHENSIAIVGSRKPTYYGEKVTREISSYIALMGIPLVSGLARGIDAIVHRSALESEGKTIAVLGSGICHLYPRENVNLAKELFKKGLVISEFPLNQFPDSSNFPRRNRIVSGLSLGTVVTECKIRSGAMITAKLAGEQGREVFAVPGMTTSSMSEGPHYLIQNGAKLVQNYNDIIDEFPVFNEKMYTEELKKREPLKNNLDFLMENEAKSVYDVIGLDPISIDQLSNKCKLDTSIFAKVLLDLEMKGAVKCLPGNRYVRC